MSKVRVEINQESLHELMKSEEMQEILSECAIEIMKQCKKGNYQSDIYVGAKRANASISSRDSATYYRNLRDNELLKALGI